MQGANGVRSTALDGRNAVLLVDKDRMEFLAHLEPGVANSYAILYKQANSWSAYCDRMAKELQPVIDRARGALAAFRDSADTARLAVDLEEAEAAVVKAQEAVEAATRAVAPASRAGQAAAQGAAQRAEAALAAKQAEVERAAGRIAELVRLERAYQGAVERREGWLRLWERWQSSMRWLDQDLVLTGSVGGRRSNQLVQAITNEKGRQGSDVTLQMSAGPPPAEKKKGWLFGR